MDPNEAEKAILPELRELLNRPLLKPNVILGFSAVETDPIDGEKIIYLPKCKLYVSVPEKLTNA